MCDADLAGGESGRVNEPDEEAAGEEGVRRGGRRRGAWVAASEEGRDIQIMVRKEGAGATKEKFLLFQSYPNEELVRIHVLPFYVLTS